MFKQRKRRGRTEEALHASEQRYLLALSGSTDGLWDWDIRSNTVFYSDRFREILGYSREEFPGEDAEPVWSAVQRHLQERVPFKIEYRLKTKSDEYLWFLARAQAIWDSEGNAVRMSGWIQDITENKQN